MPGKHHYTVLRDAYDKNHLIERGKASGVNWEEHEHEGVNWMRFSHALIHHLDEGKEISHQDEDGAQLSQMLDMYTKLRDMHKQSMIPYVRAAMTKIHSEKGDGLSRPIDVLKETYEHLDANGGHEWAEKINTLHDFNSRISRLTERVNNLKTTRAKIDGQPV